MLFLDILLLIANTVKVLKMDIFSDKIYTCSLDNDI